ncbi:hypothetical protein ABKV19_020020 [Rosa sericea]
MSKDTKSTKMGLSADSGEKEVENDLFVWTPKDFQIKRVRDNIVDSDRVSIHVVPKGANIFTGEGIPDNALVISSHHLRFLRFPIHPLFQILWHVLDLHLMQLNPNSNMLLSGLLVMGKRWEVSLGLGDFFYFHRLARIAETILFFNFAPRPHRKVFDERRIAYVPTSIDSLLSESRIRWLKDHMLSRGWNAAQFKADLDDISHPRTWAIYSPSFQVLGADVSGEELYCRKAASRPRISLKSARDQCKGGKPKNRKCLASLSKRLEPIPKLLEPTPEVTKNHEVL